MRSQRPIRVILIIGLIFTFMLMMTYRFFIAFLCLSLSTAFLISGKTVQAKSIIKAIPGILLDDVTLDKTLDRQIKK